MQDRLADSDGAPQTHCGASCVSASAGVYRGMRVQAAINDSEILYERAFQEHWPAVFKFLLAWTNDWGAAEDLTQEAFVRLWRSRDRIDWSEPVLPWLLVAGRHLATDRFRALRRRVLGIPAPASLDGQLHDRWLDVQSAMAKLSGLERTAVVLNLIFGSSTAEVAELLDTTPGAVRAAIARAREKLEAAR
jgi:RNA polymerase sigma-70 factor (ECF subfamily)